VQIKTLAQMKVLVDLALRTAKLGDTLTREEEDHLSIADGVITITPEIIEVPRLGGGTIASEGWDVIWWTHTSGGPGYHDPPEAIDKQLYSGVNPYEAAKAAVMALHADQLDSALQYYGCQGDDF
jgi:hypothetical protein